MTTPVVRLAPPAKGAHYVARPLPPPPRVRRVSELARRPLDRLGRALEQWIDDLTVGVTEAGD